MILKKYQSVLLSILYVFNITITMCPIYFLGGDTSMKLPTFGEVLVEVCLIDDDGDGDEEEQVRSSMRLQLYT